jgi:hypothetical protein
LVIHKHDFAVKSSILQERFELWIGLQTSF